MGGIPALTIRGARALRGHDWSDPIDIVIQRGRIYSIVPSADSRPADENVLDGRGLLAIPGLVNGHSHAHNVLQRATGDITWLELHILRMAEASRYWQARDYYAAAALGAVEMVRTGTTHVVDMVSAGGDDWHEKVEAVLQAYEDVGVSALVLPSLADLPFSEGLGQFGSTLSRHAKRDLDALIPARNAADQVARIVELARSWNLVHHRTTVGIAPLNPDYCSDDLLERSVAAAAAADLPLQLHCVESRLQAFQGGRGRWATTIQRLDALGVLGPRTSLAHAIWMSDADVDLVARSGTVVVHCPASNMKLGSGVLVLRRLLAREVRVHIGTDGIASSDNQNMFQAMWLSGLLSHVSSSDTDDWLSAREVFGLATTRFTDGLVGPSELEVGQRADIVLLDGASSFLNPRPGAHAALVYSEIGQSVRSVVVGGRVTLEDGRLRSVDDSALSEEVAQACARASGQIEQSSKVAEHHHELTRLQRAVARRLSPWRLAEGAVSWGAVAQD
jgi:guanine deaminase